jgi:hypothetical protein
MFLGWWCNEDSYDGHCPNNDCINKCQHYHKDIFITPFGKILTEIE